MHIRPWTQTGIRCRKILENGNRSPRISMPLVELASNFAAPFVLARLLLDL